MAMITRVLSILSSLMIACFLITAGAADVHAQGTPSPALLVGEKSGDLLAIVDPETLEIVARVPANRQPHEITSDGRYAYVSNSGQDFITVIDLERQEQAEPIDMSPLSPIHGLWVSQGKLYFANEDSRTISCYNPETGEIEWVIGTGEWMSHMLMVSEDANKIFATSMFPGTALILERVDHRRMWDISVIPTGPRAEGLDVSPDGREFWVTNVHESTISIIDVEARKEVEKIDLPTNFSNRLKFTPDGRYVVVAELQGDEVLILDARTRVQVKRIDVGGGTEGIQMDPEGSRFFISVSPENKVVVIDLETLEVAGEIHGFNNPDGLWWHVGE
jgi:DNA-binding beta-propeller fold protein YncE